MPIINMNFKHFLIQKKKVNNLPQKQLKMYYARWHSIFFLVAMFDHLQCETNYIKL